MRTAIYLGLTAIADAIRENWIGKDEQVINFLAIALVMFMLMDILEFTKKITNKQ